MSEKVQFKSLVPQLVVPDVVHAAEFYCDKLGFTLLGYFLDPPVYAMVRRDASRSISARATATRSRLMNPDGLGHDITRSSDIEGVFRELTEVGVEVIEGPVKRVYALDRNCCQGLLWL
jgi:hypothetical protein